MEMSSSRNVTTLLPPNPTGTRHTEGRMDLRVGLDTLRSILPLSGIKLRFFGHAELWPSLQGSDLRPVLRGPTEVQEDTSGGISKQLMAYVKLKKLYLAINSE
jgi:hypothetical protein